MDNNDVLRNIRYVFNFSDDEMIALFASVEHKVTRGEVSNWLRKEEDEAFEELKDIDLSRFLNGLINEKRGKREGAQPEPEKRLNNNIILRKLKIALNLKEEDMLAIFKLADLRVGKHELSAFFRKPSQRQYRECKDQFLRNFLFGMKKKYRAS